LILREEKLSTFTIKYKVNCGEQTKPIRTGHKQGEIQLIAFTCRPRQAQTLAHKTGTGRTAVSPELPSEKQEHRFLLLQCHAPSHGSILFAAIKDP
jgi:hypothetical protein